MSDLPTLYRQAWELNEHAPNAVYTVDHIGVYYEGYLVPVEPPASGAYLQWVIPGEVPEYAPVWRADDDIETQTPWKMHDWNLGKEGADDE